MSFLSNPPPISFWQDLLLGFSGLCFVGAVWTAFPRVAGLFDSWRRTQDALMGREVEQGNDFKVEVRPNRAHFVPKESAAAEQEDLEPSPF